MLSTTNVPRHRLKSLVAIGLTVLAIPMAYLNELIAILLLATPAIAYLDPGKRYEAQIYADAADADYRTNPRAYVVSKRVVTARDRLTLNLAPGGGQAIRFRALD